MKNAANFKVFQASAGAGKTFTLIKEYLKLCLANGEAVSNFKNILAITFTNAAANEMKAKIVKTLCEIIDSEKIAPKSMEAKLIEELGISDAELKLHAQSLMRSIMHDYSSFCVCTIDAFVQKLSRSFAHDLGLPSQYAVSIDTDEVAETITENLGLRIKDKDDFLTRLLIDFSNNQFDNQRSTAIESQLSEFVAKLMSEKAYKSDENNTIKDDVQYKQTLDFLNGKVRDFEHDVQKHLADFERLERQYGLREEYYSYGKSGFVAYIRKLSLRVYERPSARFDGVLEKGNCFSKDGEKQLGKERVEAANAALLPVLQAMRSGVEKGLGAFLFYKSQRDLLYLYALRSQIRMEFDKLANEEEIVHISEFNKLLNTVMGDFSVPFVYERIGEHFRHVFVDEFQDTSILQWQNLLPLIDNGLSSVNMSMVVGDGKQSIYRFRSGEVEQIVKLPEIHALPKDKPAFKQFEQNLKDNFAFKNLDTNYRSFAQIVKFNNAFFESVYTNLSPDLQKVYVSEKPGTDERVDIIQEIDKTDEGLVQVELYEAENYPDYCFERVEAIIRDLIETKGYQYADITLLTRKSDYGSKMANYLNDKEIPVVSQDSILLKSSDKVQLMINTLRYLINGDNETDVANMLFYWKLTQDPNFNGDISMAFVDVKAIAKGEKAIEPLMGIGDAGLLQDVLSKATCLYDLCANLLRVFHFDTIRDSFLNYFMEEVFKSQSGIKEGIADFLLYWDKKQDKLAVMSADSNAVKIMTIHKSKGLEFPVVIYPEAIIDLDEKLNASKAAEEWLPTGDLGFQAIPNLDKVLFKLDKNAENMGKEALDKVNKEKDSNRLDNLNLLYVAFTRAVQRLYVIAKQGKSGKPNLLKEFLADKEKFKVLEDGFGEALVYRFGSPDFMKPKEKKVDEKKELKTDSVAGDWFGKINIDSNPTLVWQSKNDKLLPREWGELIHQILAKICTVEEMELVLMPYVSNGTIDEDTAGWIRDKFLQMTQNPQIALAFDPSAKVKTECEIFYLPSETGVIRLDRYAELPDVIYLIDYKTGKEEKGHHDQLKRYTDALKEMMDKEIRAYLVYLSEDIIKLDLVSVG